MATSIDFIQFVCERLGTKYDISYKKMFGEYMVYANCKPVLLVCDNTVYVKKLDALSELMKDAETGVPYGGAKEHYILDMENDELTLAALDVLEAVTPLPKKKNKAQPR